MLGWEQCHGQWGVVSDTVWWVADDVDEIQIVDGASKAKEVDGALRCG